MTTVIERHRARKPPGWFHKLLRSWWTVVAVAVVLIMLFVVWVAEQIQRDNATAQLKQHTAAQEQELKTVADPLARLCASDETVRAAAGDTACQTAARVVQIPGPQGAQGDPGRGVVSTTINDDGHLLVTYSDGDQIDVGRVVGDDGEPGTPGRGITAANIDSGRLVLTFSDSTTQDLGPIVGERGADGQDGLDGQRGPKGDPGRGIGSTEIVGGRLVITYTDGTTEDAGPVPAGPMGPAGPAGAAAQLPSSYTENYPDGTSRTCTREAGDTNDSSPSYDCTDRRAGGEQGDSAEE